MRRGQIGLTLKRLETLEAIRMHVIEQQRPPSIRELTKTLGLKPTSTQAVDDRLWALEKLGLISREGGHIKVTGARLAWVDG